VSRVFSHGGLRLYLLSVLEEEPRHGYEIIRLVEDKFMGMYTPSAGTIYPRLTALEEDGLVQHETKDGKKVYQLTDAGRAELAERRDEIDSVISDAVQSARGMAREIRDDVRSSVRDLRLEIKDAMRDVRREERRVAREATYTEREAARIARDAAREAARAGRDVAREAAKASREVARLSRDLVSDTQVVLGREFRDVFRSLRADLEAFAADVISAARRHQLDSDRLRMVSDALLDAREAVIDALDGRTARVEGDDEPDKTARTTTAQDVTAKDEPAPSE
jgi:DNA-binding PadR family transcriptional regulator